ncbi:hypothetical protein L202_02580 [Cryptococcus amylolentus CBS 6039]|uniref:Uncharacterized protein n=1 Tax=Cryptococcus amylolentus CBS 6039 TaxID=1295533 RepID=A0A1E3I373_9TREE|nr:hypothetical protein L202_02580 [Cryptococcus amylolentus CBS 6039]ODN82301.1 hypothetical protein L202_02580 [Cryptococcus amylolentus CBS 6039]
MSVFSSAFSFQPPSDTNQQQPAPSPSPFTTHPPTFDADQPLSRALSTASIPEEDEEHDELARKAGCATLRHPFPCPFPLTTMYPADMHPSALVDTIIRFYPLHHSTPAPATRRPRPLITYSTSLPYYPPPTSPSRFIPMLPHQQPAPQPQPTSAHSASSLARGASLPPSRRASQDHLRQSRSQSVRNMPAHDPDPGLLTPSPAVNIRGNHPSPSRPKRGALSPLQTLSPLEPLKASPPVRVTDTAGAGPRRASLTRSLSRRESMVENAAAWRRGEEVGGDGRGLFSRLTLVKAPAAEKKDERKHTRSKSGSSLMPFNSFASYSDAPATSASGPRRSFAASSFGASPSAHSAGLPMPDAVNRGSAHRVESRSGNGRNVQKDKLFSPEQVVELARSINSPKAALSPLHCAKSARSLRSFGSFDGSPERPQAELEPVEYMQMEDDVLLPFIDRPSEVADLIAHPSNTKLFALLRAAFPKEPARPEWKSLDPAQWRWDEFLLHLTQVPRSEVDDYDWVFKDRQAVRSHSVALWEKLGTCLGCDEALLNAGSEDGSPNTWAGLGLDDDGEQDAPDSHVWIEGLAAEDQTERAHAERQLRDAFGGIVEDEGEAAAAGMTALLGPIGEGNGRQEKGGELTPAQRAGQKDKIDPMGMGLGLGGITESPVDATFGHRKSESCSPTTSTAPRQSRPSFVGLQICTLPSNGHSFSRSPSLTTTSLSASASAHNTSPPSPSLSTTSHLPLYTYDRDPGNPLFPSSFSNLSLEPNLGRRASSTVNGAAGGMFGKGGGGAVPMREDVVGELRRKGLGFGGRKASQAGLSESESFFSFLPFSCL